MGISKFFNSLSKKRDLSDQSCDGEEPKKARELQCFIRGCFYRRYEFTLVFTYSCQLYEKY